MNSKIIIIPPDYVKNNKYFEHDLFSGQFHDEILYEYCVQNKLLENNIIDLVNNNYIVIETYGKAYVSYFPADVSNNQLFWIKKLLLRNVEMETSIIKDGKMKIIGGKITTYEKLLDIFDNLKKEKEGMNCVR